MSAKAAKYAPPTAPPPEAAYPDDTYGKAGTLYLVERKANIRARAAFAWLVVTARAQIEALPPRDPSRERREWFVTMPQLAAALSISTKTAQSAMKDLLSSGLVLRHCPDAGGRWAYRFLAPPRRTFTP